MPFVSLILENCFIKMLAFCGKQVMWGVEPMEAILIQGEVDCYCSDNGRKGFSKIALQMCDIAM